MSLLLLTIIFQEERAQQTNFDSNFKVVIFAAHYYSCDFSSLYLNINHTANNSLVGKYEYFQMKDQEYFALMKNLQQVRITISLNY